VELACANLRQSQFHFDELQTLASRREMFGVCKTCLPSSGIIQPRQCKPGHSFFGTDAHYIFQGSRRRIVDPPATAGGTDLMPASVSDF